MLRPKYQLGTPGSRQCPICPTRKTPFGTRYNKRHQGVVDFVPLSHAIEPGHVGQRGSKQERESIKMRPRDISIWRNALGLTQAEVAAACGRQRDWCCRLENGDIPIPRWFIYLVAWTRLYGVQVPFSAADTPAKMRELRERWGITQVDLGNLLGLSRDVIIAAEKGRPRPMGIAFAIAWIDFYGSRLPFTTLLVPIPRCPHCGK